MVSERSRRRTPAPEGRSGQTGGVPELPEVERARQAIEAALDREIRAVDDGDEWVCRPHRPGEPYQEVGFGM